MPHTTPEQMGFTIRDIVDACQHWANFNGFTATRCHHCKKTANVLGGGPGYICPCGHFNGMSIHGFNIPYVSPDYGPSRLKMRTAFRISRQLDRLKLIKRKLDSWVYSFRNWFFNSNNSVISLTIS